MASLGRDPAQRQSRREGAGKTGEAGTEKGRNSCGKNGKRCTAPCMEHEGYEVSLMERQKGETRSCLDRRAQARDFYEPRTESCLAGASVVLPKNGAELHGRPESHRALSCRTRAGLEHVAICMTSSCFAVRSA